ncbi:MAG: hypothetical protein ACRC7N_17025 [Clostridium sp.]
MIEKIKSSLKIEFKLFYRNKINFVPLILLVALMLISSFTNSKTLDIYVKSNFLTQIIILSFIFIGYNIGKNEDEVKHIFDIICSSNIIKLISKIIFITIIILVINLLFYFISIINLKVGNVNTVFYYEGFMYSILYWLLPSLISLIIGLAISKLINGVIAYGLIILSAIIIGPMNMEVSQLIGLTDVVDLRKLIVELNIGQYSNYLMDPLYGLEIEYGRFIHSLIVLILVILILIIISYFKEKNKNIYFLLNSIPLILIGVVLINIYIKPEFIYKNGHYENISKNRYDIEYYSHIKGVPKKESNIKVIENSIKISDEDVLDVEIELTIEILEECDKLDFTLYRDLKIEKLLLNNEEVKYTQKGDFVELTSKLEKNERVNLYFKYSGLSSPKYYYSNKAILLVNYFPWIPISGRHSIMDSEGVTNYITENNTIKYFLDYKGNKKIYTNLSKNEKGMYEGESSSGVFIVAGLLESRYYNNKEVVIPLSYSKFSNDLNGNLEILDRTLNRISSILKDVDANYKRVLVLPLPQKGGSNYTIIEEEENILISLNNEINLREDFCLENILYGILSKKNIGLDNSSVELFIYNFQNYYYKLYDIKDGDSIRFKSKDDKIVEMNNKINLYISSRSNEEIDILFNKWLEKLIKNEEVQLEYIDLLLK